MYSLMSLSPRYDAIVVGARCGGAATALLLARSGAKVLLIDRQAYGSDTLSTHALMRGAVFQLHRWGLVPHVDAALTPRIRATTFHYGAHAVRVPIKPQHGIDCLYAPRRTVLDRLLVDAARDAGVHVRHGVLLADVERAAGGRVTGAVLKTSGGAVATVHAEIVIGADGRRSTLAQLVDARSHVEATSSSGIAFGYFEGLQLDGSHWYFAQNAAAGVIPTNGGHCVFAAVPSQQFVSTFRDDVVRGFFEVLGAINPHLRIAVESCPLVGRMRGFGGAPGYLRQCHGAGWALVGDAGYFKDPLTAHGITDALRDAELLARAILAGSANALVDYQRERDALSRPFLEITDKIASFDWGIDEVKHLHEQLSTAMKAETHHLAALSNAPPLAA